MNKLLLRLALWLATAALALAQTVNVQKVPATNNLTSGFDVASGQTITVESGGTVTFASGAALNLPDNALAIGDVTGLQTALDAKAPTANPSFTGTVTVPDGALAIADTSGLQTALDARQPLDADLTSIAGLSTTSFGRSLLTQADAAALRTTASAAQVASDGRVVTPAWSRPPLAPRPLLRHSLGSYVAPETGTVTLSHTRNFEVAQLLSTGLWSEAGHNTAAFTWDAALGRNRYKSTGAATSAVPTGATRNFTNAAWVKTNITAALDQVGLTGVANSASSLTATADNGTCIDDLGTIASAERTFSAWVRRITGSGRVWITRNGGTHWLDITSQINTGAWARVSITTTIADPDVGFRLETSGDAIAVDSATDLPGREIYDPMLTRGDQAASTLNLASMVPATVQGRRYLAQIRVRHRGPQTTSNSQQSQLTLDNGTAVTTNGWRIAHTPEGAWSIASWRDSVLQYNAGISSTPRAYAGQDQTIAVAWGGGRMETLVDGAVVNVQDTVGKLDPAALSRVQLTGDAEFCDLVVSQLRSHNIALVGDSITAESYYPAMWRRNLAPLDYAIAARGVSGNRIPDVTARVASDVTPAFIQQATSNTVVLWIGTNSLADNVSAATALTQLSTLISTIRAGAGWDRVVCISVLKRNGGFSNGADATSFEAQRLIYNAGMVAAGADAVIDVSTVTEAQDTSNLNYWDSFQIHPRPALYELFWPIIRAAF